jgi:hypothetical protein
METIHKGIQEGEKKKRILLPIEKSHSRTRKRARWARFFPWKAGVMKIESGKRKNKLNQK